MCVYVQTVHKKKIDLVHIRNWAENPGDSRRDSDFGSSSKFVSPIRILASAAALIA
jgi:hypothetical protein